MWMLFNDPLIDNKDSKKRYRADVLIEDHIAKIEAKIEKDCVKAASNVLETTLIEKSLFLRMEEF